MSLNLATGSFSSGAHPTTHEVRRLAREMARQLAAGASLDLRFVDGLYYRKDVATGDDELLPAFELLATCSRASLKYYPNWSGRSGDPVGRLIKFGVDQRATGDLGPLDEGVGENLIEYERTEGAVLGVLGSGGELPTGWGASTDGTTIEVTDAGSERGWRHVELEIVASGAASPIIYFAGAAEIAAATGNERTLSVTARAVGSVIANFSGIQLRQDERTASAFVSPNTKAVEAVTTELARYGHPVTLSGGGTVAYVRPAAQLTFSGAGTQRIRLSMPQLETGLVATSPMIKEFGETGTATRAADVISRLTISRASRKSNAGEWDFKSGGVYGHHIEFAPGVAALTGKGLLVDPATTNWIRNPLGVGAAAGSPGTLPTHWLTQLSGGVSVDVVGSGKSAGARYVDLRVHGAVTPGVATIYLESSSSVPALQNEIWTMATGLQVVGGTAANINYVNLGQVERSDAGVALAVNNSASFMPDHQHRRWVQTVTMSNGSTAYVQPRIDIRTGTGDVDITVRIFLPQLEKKSYATSPAMPLDGVIGATTRAADKITLTGDVWLTGGRGTLFAEGVVPQAVASSADPDRAGTLAFLRPNTSRGIVVGLDRFEDEAEFSLRAEDYTTNSATRPLGDLSVGDRIALALAWDGDTWSASATGATQVVGSVLSGDEFPDQDLQLGWGWPGGGSPNDANLSSYLRRVSFWDYRLSNAALEDLAA
ncbi:hypothetical protein [Maricaulis maris]|uniref:Uncharacterized protein n=2 Tax=Maricaulis maris TaxID=74318 RepID=A0A495CVR3_9PROT|nr:hypothetical protein [Maricaulis maris]RKQ89485.1 hypothetical protein C7435_3413 [Maricaulis maris]